MANLKIDTSHFPLCLGKVIPGTSCTTASVPITQANTPVMTDGVSIQPYYKELQIIAWGGNASAAANTANIYICTNNSNPDFTNFSNIAAVLTPGAVFPRGPHSWGAVYDIRNFWIGADNSTDFAIVVIDQ